MNQLNKNLVDSLMAFMPTPEEADAMGVYNIVVARGEVYSYKGEYLGTVQEVENAKWLREMLDKVNSGDLSEDEFEQMCEER